MAGDEKNAYMERFNRTYRDEVLGAYLFEDLRQVRIETERFIWKYNNIRPHDSLNNVTPRAFLLKRGKHSAAQAAAEYPTLQHRVYDDYYDIRT